jgi:DNA-binding NarL/FixJ family response regulator
MSSARSFDLTPSELRVYLHIVEDGLRDREIRARVGYSVGGLKTCIHRILQKKGAASRVDLVVKHWKGKKL